MPYQFKREPLTQDEANRLANAHLFPSAYRKAQKYLLKNPSCTFQ